MVEQKLEVMHIAGGFPERITGVGDAGINKSIGSQWKNNVTDMDVSIREMANGMSEEDRKKLFLNIVLKGASQ